MSASIKINCVKAGLAALIVGTSQPALAADRALVIGINDYPGLTLATPLTSAKADAESFAAFLQEHQGFAPDEITVLTNAQATSEAIIAALIEKLIGETHPGDRAVFYFAGLGARKADPGGVDEDGMKEVLLAYDAPDLLGQIPRDAIADMLDLISEHEVTVVIDAAFDPPDPDLPGAATSRATAFEFNNLAQASFSEAPFGSGNFERAVWNAAAPGQPAWEAGGRGVFSKAFIEGLSTGAADANGNGTVTNAELLKFLRDRSEVWCSASSQCAGSGPRLTPHFSGPVQGVVFSKPTPDPAPPERTENVLPVSTLEEEALTYNDTLGFVTDLFTPSNAAELQLALSTDGPLRIGDTVSFKVDASRDGTLVLLDINPNGELAQVYPSSLSRDGATKMTAGAQLVIPSGKSASGAPLRMRVTEPHGQGFLLGLFVEGDLPRLTALLPENLSGGPIPNAGQYLYEIAQDLLKLQAGDGGNASTEWSATYLPYEILPN